MNLRTVLGLAAGLAALLAVLLIAEWVSKPPQATGEHLFAGMREDINAVTSVTATAAGDNLIATVTRQDDRWIVEERDGYPADTGKLRQLLLGLAEAQLVEAKTANREYYARLGVEDVSAEDAGGVLIRVVTPSNQYAVIVGDQTRGEYRYVRREGEAGSWLIDKSPEAPTETPKWLSATIIDIDAAVVRSVTIEHPDGQTINLEKANREARDFSVTNMPAGRELSYASVANTVGGVLDNLTLDDVAPAAELGPDAVITTFTTFDGQVIHIASKEVDSKYWIQLTGAYDAALAEQQAAPQQAETTAADAVQTATGEDKTAAAQAAIDALNERTRQWRYQIPQYKYEQLTRRWQDLLKNETD